jgi:hypothetical protein
MCHVKLLLASRVCPTPIQGVLVVVVSQITPMQWFFCAFYHDIKKSIQFPLAFIDRLHHCAQLPTDTEIYLHPSSLNTSGIYYGLDILERIKCVVTHKTALPITSHSSATVNIGEQLSIHSNKET